MIKKILLSAGVPIVLLVVIAGCGHGAGNAPNSNAPDMTNVPPPPPVSSTNLSVPPVTNTNLLNTNLTTDATVTNKP